MYEFKIKKSVSKIKPLPDSYFDDSKKVSEINSISKYVNQLIKLNDVSANSLAQYYGISAAQMNKITSGKLDDPSPIQAARFCSDFKINLSTLKFLLPNKEESFFFDVENKLVNNIQFNYSIEKYKQFLEKDEVIYLNHKLYDKIKNQNNIDEKITFKFNLPNHLENNNILDYILTYGSNKKVGLILLPNRNRKTRPSYWDDDLRDFTNKIIDIISDNGALNNINDILFITESIYVYNKISKKFKDKPKIIDKNVRLVYVDLIKNDFLFTDIFLCSNSARRRD